MSDMPIGWDRARAAYENDCNDGAWAVCEGCDRAACCDADPSDCEADACERAAEERWEAARDCYD